VASRRPASDPGPDVSAERVRAFRLRRHHLLERAPRRHLARVAGEVGGLQAQLLPAAAQALGVRVEGITEEDVARAIEPNRRLTRAWCMRRTVHLVPSKDLAEFVRGSARRAEREVRWLTNRGVPPARAEQIMAATLAALDEPRTRADLAAAVAGALGVPVRSWDGEGWGNRRPVPGVALGALTLPAGYLLHLAGSRGVVLHAPNREGQARYVRADRWLRAYEDLPVEDAERRLLRRYLRAYGPATPVDFAAWSGLKVTEARALWDSEGDRIAPVRVAGREAGVRAEDRAELERSELAGAPVRLLPYFDSFLMGHSSRDPVLDPAREAEVSRSSGWIAPTILVEGRVAGVWSMERNGPRLVVRLAPFAPLSRPVRAGVRDEVDELARFLGLDSGEVRVGARA
jgi:hypothetical protein